MGCSSMNKDGNGVLLLYIYGLFTTAFFFFNLGNMKNSQAKENIAMKLQLHLALQLPFVFLTCHWTQILQSQLNLTPIHLVNYLGGAHDWWGWFGSIECAQDPKPRTQKASIMAISWPSKNFDLDFFVEEIIETRKRLVGHSFHGCFDRWKEFLDRRLVERHYCPQGNDADHKLRKTAIGSGGTPFKPISEVPEEKLESWITFGTSPTHCAKLYDKIKRTGHPIYLRAGWISASYLVYWEAVLNWRAERKGKELAYMSELLLMQIAKEVAREMLSEGLLYSPAPSLVLPQFLVMHIFGLHVTSASLTLWMSLLVMGLRAGNPTDSETSFISSTDSTSCSPRLVLPLWLRSSYFLKISMDMIQLEFSTKFTFGFIRGYQILPNPQLFNQLVFKNPPS
ncbi:hypothetical protein VP01_1431g2 [Puccinia sorghi]|uniref:Uncharacterized protein n=1 Tax=Puccinia sorghi TaxID=27349 RepID=A0A0L6VKE5_9BASI|nr:hypothetical protein VP01_1431g2 [Puccinia sorghi]